MLELDGSHGEGGGQLLRTACALAAITGTAVRLRNIRARRSPPGLAPQHLMAVQAVAELSGARVEKLALRSPEIVFRPSPLRGGSFRFDVGTAGAITLVLQACLPVAVAGPAPVSMIITGGTDVRAAPPLDYFRFVLLPLLERLGLELTLDVKRRGYYPRGGGEIEVRVTPGARPEPLRLEAPGALRKIEGLAHCANLPAHIAERMRRAALHGLAPYPAEIDTRVLARAEAIGPGGAIVLWARREHALLGTGAVAEHGVPAEHLGERAARELRAEIESGATLDVHAADQLLVYLARARGDSHFLVREFSSHARTKLWVLEQFLPLRHEVSAVGALTRVAIFPQPETTA